MAVTLTTFSEADVADWFATRDINKALPMALDINSGMVHINAPTIHDEPHVPFGGTGDSGFGREGTDIDIDTLTEWKWITVQLPVTP